MNYADLTKLTATEAGASPFPHLLCQDFVRAEKLPDIHRDFPVPPGAGSFPLSALKCGAAFAGLIEELRSAETAKILAEKLNAPIEGRPTMATVRGFCRQTDGKIHRDSGGKLITVLLYLNPDWNDNAGGRLRLLRNGEDIDDYFLEVPPAGGALLAFRCDDNAWHGHLPFAGERRAIQLNWVTNQSYCRREVTRHFFSAAVKKTLAAFFGRRV